MGAATARPPIRRNDATLRRCACKHVREEFAKLAADDARVLEQTFEVTFAAAALGSQNHKLQNPETYTGIGSSSSTSLVS